MFQVLLFPGYHDPFRPKVAAILVPFRSGVESAPASKAELMGYVGHYACEIKMAVGHVHAEDATFAELVEIEDHRFLGEQSGFHILLAPSAGFDNQHVIETFNTSAL